MMRPLRWVRIVTLANVVVASLVILIVYGTMLALAAIAPEISTWQLLTLLSVGVPVSVIGLRLAIKVGSHGWRRRGLIINGGALALYSAIIIGMGVLFFTTTKQRFIIPEGYMGDVFVIYGAVDGEPKKIGRDGITLRVHSDGILHTSAPIVDRWTNTEYYYELADGTQYPIRNLWSTTVQRTPENLTNDKDIGVFFPRSGKITDSAGCSVEYEEFYVGTKAHLLSGYAERDTNPFLKERCGGGRSR